ncbi:MAG TPA: oligosaccharide flippase family protein [Anaerolineaceae bacterium]|nr:oligosaccharide flippase family protein [Anaerolineaceae bacterium]HQH85069.1 oligosaccharide flippase family protein [Anaerolineaceae bacterium]
MLRSLRQLSSDTLYYGLASALQKLIGLVLFPVYARLLSKSDFGIQDLILTATTVAFTILALGLNNGVAREYYEQNSDEARRSLLSTWFWFQLLVAVPICALLVIFAAPVCDLIFDRPELAVYFQIGISTVPFTLLNNIVALTLRLNFRARRYALLAGLAALVQMLLTILLVAVFDLGLKGVFWALWLGAAAQAAIGFVLTHGNFGRQFDAHWLRPILTFGLPIVPAGLGMWVLNSSNRYFMVRLGTLEDIALLGAGTRVGSLIGFVVTAFMTAWPMFAFSVLKDQDQARKIYSVVLTYFLLLALSATVLLSLFAREAILILATNRYLESALLVPWVALAAVVWGAGDIVGMGFSIARKTYHIILATAIGAAVTIALNLILIGPYGAMGAVLASLAGNLATFGYLYWAGQHYFPVKYAYSRIAALVFLSLLVIICGLFWDRLSIQSFWLQLAGKIALALAYGAGIFAFRLITLADLKQAWARLRNRNSSSGGQAPGVTHDENIPPAA